MQQVMQRKVEDYWVHFQCFFFRKRTVALVGEKYYYLKKHDCGHPRQKVYSNISGTPFIGPKRLA